MTALQHALDRLALAFGNPNGRALTMARNALRYGAAHPATRARYAVLATIAADCRFDPHAAVIWLDRHIADMRRRNRVGFGHVLPLDIEIAKEARIICRWMRRHRPEMWLWVLSAITVPAGQPFRAPGMMEAAE